MNLACINYTYDILLVSNIYDEGSIKYDRNRTK